MDQWIILILFILLLKRAPLFVKLVPRTAGKTQEHGLQNGYPVMVV